MNELESSLTTPPTSPLEEAKATHNVPQPAPLSRLIFLYCLAALTIALITWWMLQVSRSQRHDTLINNPVTRPVGAVANNQVTGSSNLSPAPTNPSTSSLIIPNATTTAAPPNVDGRAVVVLDDTAPVVSSYTGDATVDVLVYGSEPEAISAAVSAAEQGAKVVLVTPDPKMGGLFVMGQMNSLDLRTEPVLMQRGLFERWWDMVGRGSAFDVQEAEAAFEKLLADAGVQVVRGAQDVDAITSEGRVVGLEFGTQSITAKHVIDGSADADIAAQVGVPYSMGFASMGIDARMVDTLVFRIDGVNWRALRREIQRRGKSYAEVNDHVAWGHFGRKWINEYDAQEEGIRLRGLNLGRQNDGSILVNALLIHGIDPFDEASRAEGKARATREAAHIIDLLKTEINAFSNASLGGVAPSLYIRETQHIFAECMLTIDDVMGNVVTARDVAAGGYPLDVQVLTPNDTGFVYGVPEIYGVQLCVTVPLGIDGLWVVGKAAGYDPLAASSTRVVPFGMALAEAVGVAAVHAGTENPSDFINNDANITTVRQILQQRGAYLPEVKPRNPSGPYQHEFFDAFVTLRRKALALGGYNNDPQLDATMPAIGYVYLLGNVSERFYNRDGLAQFLIDMVGFPDGELTPELALNFSQQAACGLEVYNQCEESSWEDLVNAGFAPRRFPPTKALTRGEAYALAAAIAERAE